MLCNRAGVLKYTAASDNIFPQCSKHQNGSLGFVHCNQENAGKPVKLLMEIEGLLLDNDLTDAIS